MVSRTNLLKSFPSIFNKGLIFCFGFGILNTTETFHWPPVLRRLCYVFHCSLLSQDDLHCHPGLSHPRFLFLQKFATHCLIVWANVRAYHWWLGWDWHQLWSPLLHHWSLPQCMLMCLCCSGVAPPLYSSSGSPEANWHSNIKLDHCAAV